jgi:protein tyrosine/serine phosphatase
MNPRRSVASALALALCVIGVASAQENKGFAELPKFSQVNPNLFRGAQPKEGGIDRLKNMGIKTIINLRDSGDQTRNEEDEATTKGLRYFNIPLPNFDRPSDETVSQILSLITSSENQPVFVHCKRGSDRTGTIIALYRIEYDGWTGDRAKSEAKQHGMGFWQYKMKDYIEDYYTRRSRQTKVDQMKSSKQPTASHPLFEY